MKEVNFDSGKNLLLRWAGVKKILPKEVFWFDLRSKVKQMIKHILEYSLNKELEAILKAKKYQHTPLREGYRNGYYMRSLITHLCGRIDNFLIPRSRRKIRFNLIDKYKRRLDEFDYAVLNCFLNGSSTRKTAKFFYNFFSESNISHQTVSNILKKIDSLVNQFLKKKITDDYLFLIVDAKYIKINPPNKRKKPCLFCIGIKEDLSYEILYFKIVSSENEINYTNFFFDLKDKGLEGNNLRMLICDGKRAIENAFLFVYPNKDIQICSVHYVREALRYIKNKKLLPSIRKQAYNLYKSKTKDEFLNKLNTLKKEYQSKESKFFKILLKTIDKTLTFYNYPDRFHSLIKSTNLIERFLRDIEQLTRYWAQFKDIRSANRVIYLLVERFNNSLNDGGYSLFKRFTQFC
jgi:transposase-like protein